LPLTKKLEDSPLERIRQFLESHQTFGDGPLLICNWFAGIMPVGGVNMYNDLIAIQQSFLRAYWISSLIAAEVLLEAVLSSTRQAKGDLRGRRRSLQLVAQGGHRLDMPVVFTQD
jgi:hypothetical protein